MKAELTKAIGTGQDRIVINMTIDEAEEINRVLTLYKNMTGEVTNAPWNYNRLVGKILIEKEFLKCPLSTEAV